MKISTFKEESHLDTNLIEAVINQLGGKASFKQSAPDITNYGIDGGFGSFVYHTDTIAFFDQNKALILALAQEQAKDFGVDMIAMIASFNCLHGSYTHTEIMQGIYESDSESETQIKNALAWYAGEEVARSYTDLSGGE